MPDFLNQIRTVAFEPFGRNIRLFAVSRQPLLWALALIIGVAAAYGAIALRVLIAGVHFSWSGLFSEHTLTAFAAIPGWLVVLVPVAGGLIVGLINLKFLGGGKPQGIAEVIEAQAVSSDPIPLRPGVWSAVAHAISLGTGASAGREGPAVHLGALIASEIGRFFHFEPGQWRILLAAGVASAVAASFNAPIAGVLFALEVILRHYALSAFVPIVIASVAGTIISRIHLGNFPAFMLPAYEISSFWEFPAFALLGVICALIACTFLSSTMLANWAWNKIPVPRFLHPMLAGLVLGIAALWLPEILGIGYGATDNALNKVYGFGFLLLLLFAKLIATSITMTSGFGGGVFSPSLYLGAMGGAAFGIGISQVFPMMVSEYGLYALVGMGAVSAAVLGAPISTLLIVFEVTGGYDVIIALMLAISIATALTQVVHGRSFIFWQLESRGLYLQEGPHKRIVRSLKVDQFMTGLPDEWTPKQWTPEDAPHVNSGDTLEMVLDLFQQTGAEQLYVTDIADESKIIGIASHQAALEAFNKALINAAEEEHR